MVIGVESFREAFKGYEDCYTIIGGTACDILMTEANLEFRATKDIDMIMLIENRFEEFGQVFWKYVESGGYKYGWKSSNALHFYRFTEPRELNYPVMIELFSKNPGYPLRESNLIITPLHISDDVSSLSAIMLNDEYYRFMLEGRRIVEGIGILRAEYLIPFKMKAWIDLNSKKKSGEHVNIKDLKKHKNDVFRLMNLVSSEHKIQCTDLLKLDIKNFIHAMKSETVALEKIGLDMELNDALTILESIYL